MKNINFFLSENFQFLVVKFSIYLNRRVFVMININVKLYISAPSTSWFYMVQTDCHFSGSAETSANVTVQNYRTEYLVQKNSRLILDCSIRPLTETMTYTWMKDGQELLPQKRLYFASNGSLIIERVINKKRKGRSDEGLYECTGENSLGTVIGRRVNIKIESK